ncbi:MAG: asparagine synthase (glutamine-hydrolyzing) [Thermoanaerobaculaceae bacterium]
MCGIFGFVGFVERGRATTCLQAVAHRGPDYRAIWHQPHVTLGHARLSILDLSPRAHQPLRSLDGRYWITYNGEVYNYVELRAELERRGHRFATSSDTEVVLAAFLEWGEGCQARFNGMWALAIWDDRDRRLFLSRDRFGKKPLFYAQLSDGFAFASEMKGLLPLLPARRANADLILDIQLRMFGYERSEECLVAGIRRLPAGNCAWLMPGAQLSVRRWWSVLDHLVSVPEAYSDQVAVLRSLVLDACRLRMRSDVPYATCLSGGLDSSAVLAGVSALQLPSSMGNSHTPRAFSATFPGTPLDEVDYARRVATALRVPQTVLDIDPIEGLRHLDEFIYLFEEIYVACPIPFMLLFREVARNGVKTTLDGHGADEVFAGYSFDYVRALRDSGLNPLKTRMVLDTLYDDRITSPQFRLPSKWRYWVSWQIDEWRRGRRNSEAVDHAAWRQMDHLNQQLYLSVERTLLPTLLRNYDRYSMAYGVEIRMPLVDHRVIAFGLSLPWTSKVRGGYSKAILRDAMAPFLPPDIAYRKRKVYFSPPIIDWMKGPLRAFFLDTIESVAFRTCALVDAPSACTKVMACLNDPTATFKEGEAAWVSIYPYLWEGALLRRPAEPTRPDAIDWLEPVSCNVER